MAGTVEQWQQVTRILARNLLALNVSYSGAVDMFRDALIEEALEQCGYQPAHAAARLQCFENTIRYHQKQRKERTRARGAAQ